MKMRGVGGRKRRGLAVAAAAAAAVVVAGGVALAATVTGMSQDLSTASSGGTPSQASSATSSVKAASTVKPAVTASKAPKSSPAKHTPTGEVPTGKVPTGKVPTGKVPAAQPARTPAASPAMPSAPSPSAGSQSPQQTAAGSVPATAATFPPLTFLQMPTYMGQGTIGKAFSWAPGEAEGGRAPYTWTVTGLPPGLTATKIQENIANPFALSITGTPTAVGVFHIAATVRDNENPPQNLTRRYEIEIDPPSWSIKANLPNGTVGVPYTGSFTATNGVTATWSAEALPAGLTINPGTGVVSGTPTAAANTTFTIYATVTQPLVGTKKKWEAIGITINPAWSIKTGLPNGTVGVPYTGTVTVTNGFTATWSAEGLPAGLTINPGTGVVSGTPTAVFDTSVRIIATVNQPLIGDTMQWKITNIIISR